MLPDLSTGSMTPALKRWFAKIPFEGIGKWSVSRFSKLFSLSGGKIYTSRRWSDADENVYRQFSGRGRGR